jgi:hypothetical protein
MSENNKHTTESAPCCSRPSDCSGGAGKGSDCQQKEPAGAVGRFGTRVRVDRPNRELYVSTTRAVAGVSVASFCGLLIGIVALSRNASHNGPQSAQAVAPAVLHPSIIDPAERERETPRSAPAVKTTPATPKATLVGVPQAVKTPVAAVPTTSPVPNPVPQISPGESRIVGQTYFVFGSYPRPGEAKKAAERMESHGVSCSVVQNLPGWTHKGWYTVVSVKGYESTKDATYQRELKTLQSKELEPHGYKWRTVNKA